MSVSSSSTSIQMTSPATATTSQIPPPSSTKNQEPIEKTRLKIKHCCQWFFGYGFLWILTGTISSVFDMGVIDKNWDNGALKWFAAICCSIVGGAIGSSLMCCLKEKKISTCCTKDIEGAEKNGCLKFASCITRIGRCALKLLFTKSCVLGGFLSAFGDDLVDKEWSGQQVVAEMIAGVVCGGFITWIAENCEKNFCNDWDPHQEIEDEEPTIQLNEITTQVNPSNP